jgi:hypothetical protein
MRLKHAYYTQEGDFSFWRTEIELQIEVLFLCSFAEADAVGLCSDAGTSELKVYN